MSKKTVFLVIVLLLFHLFIRSTHILAQAPYVDEGFHLVRATTIWDFEENPGRLAGKLLLYYWLGLFEAENTVILVTGRLSVALFSMLAAAVIFRLVRGMAGTRLALAALGFYALFPLAVWYERLAFADPFAGALGALLVWRSLLFAKRPSWREAVLLGLLITATPMAKLTLALVPLFPFLATLFMGQRLWPSADKGAFGQKLWASLRAWWRLYGLKFVLAGAISLAVWAPMLIPAYLAQDSDEPYVIVNPEIIAERSEAADTTGYNSYIEELWPALEDFTTAAFFYALGVASLVVIALGSMTERRLGLLLVAWLLLSVVLSLGLAKYAAVRYYMPLAIPAVVILAVALGRLAALERLRGVAVPLAGVAALLYLFTFALPFVRTATDDPMQLRFHNSNYHNFQSGHIIGDETIRAVAAYYNANAQADEPFIANWKLCHLLFFYLDPLNTICIEDDNVIPQVEGIVQREFDPQSQAYFALMGWPPYIERITSLEAEALFTARRPNGVRPVTVWQIELSEEGIARYESRIQQVQRED